MSESENVETASETSTAVEARTLKAAAYIGKVVEVIGARDVPGKFGPQVALQVKGGHVVYVKATSGIAKGLKNGKLHPSMATPLRLTGTTAYGSKEPYATWTLAPKA